MQVAEVSFGQVEVPIFLRKLNFTFSRTGLAPLHTALDSRTFAACKVLQCVGTDEAHMARSERLTSAGCFLQVAEGSFGKDKIALFLRKMKFNLL